MNSYEELVAQRAEIDRKIEEMLRAEKAEAVATVKKLVAQFELSPDECGFKGLGRASREKSQIAPLYRGPNGETWTGRGLPPKWLKALEANGQPRSNFRIAN